MSTNETMTHLEKLKDLYSKEINFRLSIFWDGGWEYRLGAEVNGFSCKITAASLEAAIDGLYDMAMAGSCFRKKK